MEFNFLQMWEHMGLAALAVAAVLLAMGLASLTVFAERIITLRRSRTASRAFAADLGDDLITGDFDAVIAQAENYPRGYLARVLATGLKTHRSAQQTTDLAGLSPLERTQRHMQRYMEDIGSDLRRGLSVLASIGSTAPFVGLLGTVLGIISAFRGIADTGAGGLSAVSAGISEALVETALGLTVAIPAVLAFNYLSTAITREEQALNHAFGELLDAIEGRAEQPPANRARAAATPAPPDGTARRWHTEQQAPLARAGGSSGSG